MADRHRPRTGYAKSGGLSIAYFTLGDGPLDIVFVPGFISHIDIGWEEPMQRHVTERLASFSRYITFDKRGTGLSDRSVSALSSIEERMDDIRAVMDAVQCKRAALIGYSEGGPLALLFAATYPERVSALVLSGTYGRLAPRADLEEQLALLEANWGNGLAISRVFRRGTDQDWAARYERGSATPQAAAELLRMNTSLDVTSALPAISVPTLVIHRTNDPVVSFEHGRDLAAGIDGATFREVDGDSHLPASTHEWNDELDVIEEFITGARPVAEADRVLATVMFTDICASTERAAAAGDRAWRDVLERHHRDVSALVERYRGRQVKSTGDGVLATFDGPSRAVRCASEVVESARRAGVEVRAGLHTGEVELIGDDIAGIAVHLAQRVESKAEPGRVFVSQTVRDLLAGSGVELEERGVHTLKGVPGDWQLFAVAATGTGTRTG